MNIIIEIDSCSFGYNKYIDIIIKNTYNLLKTILLIQLFINYAS